MSQSSRQLRVCIIGGGVAGLGCAWSLSRFPERYRVELWEKESRVGGVATSEQLQLSGDDKFWLNDGVQGGAPSYKNILLFLRLFEFDVHPVRMTVSFGKEKHAWNNTTVTPLIEQLKEEIKKFGSILKLIHYLEFVFLFIPIDKVLSFFHFSSTFRNHIVFPLVALFFGTGNQTPYVSSAIIARVFLDSKLKLFDYHPEYFLNQQPEMFALPNLTQLYQTVKEKLESANGSTTKICTNRGASSVRRLSTGEVSITDANGKTQTFDKVVFACDAQTALSLLQEPTWLEKKILGNVQYFDDVTITHTDVNYMKRYYEVNEDRKDQYFIRTHPTQPEKLEMSFNLSNYQLQLKQRKDKQSSSTSSHSQPDIYQTIFLDKTREDLWSIADIDASKVVLKKWWHQFSHTWKHFTFTVPFIPLIQNTHHNTYYCGAYTLINTHEIALISGLAVAERLGAPYPFAVEPLALEQFETYKMVAHGIYPIKIKLLIILAIVTLLYFLF